MILPRTSIIYDRKSCYSLIDTTVNIIKNLYGDEFHINDLASLNSFSPKEKETLQQIFSPNITIIHAWQHNFYFEGDFWRYEEATYNYEETMSHIFLLLNTNKTSIGKIVCPNDYQFIESIYRGWLNLLDDETRSLLYEEIYFDERDFILFVSHDLKTRLGDSCFFNFEFLKTFMEAKSDYHFKKMNDTICRVANLRS